LTASRFAQRTRHKKSPFFVWVLKKGARHPIHGHAFIIHQGT
jgi:hypothetical protein